jgi:transcriptional regulator with XRE-family HTH domain
MHRTPTPTVIRLRADAFAAWAARLELETESAQAERIGIDRATLSRVRRGEIVPGEKFIAAMLAAYDGTFEEMFEVTT